MAQKGITVPPLSADAAPVQRHAARRAVSAAAARVKAAGESIQGVASKVAVALLDRDGDGKVDGADLKIMQAQAGRAAKTAANAAGRITKYAAQSDLARDAAAGAIVGGAIGTAVPLVGTATCGAIGAAVGVARNFTRDRPAAPPPAEPRSENRPKRRRKRAAR